MTAVLAYEMMSRGKDATGIATVSPRGHVAVRKKDEPANLFLASRKGIGRNAIAAIIHTRAATQGRPENNANNHPVVNGNIVGIHNGVMYNDDHLFRHYPGWERTAEVDSEAIFAAIHHLGPHRAAEALDGSWAIAWIDKTDPLRLHIARGESSPLYYMNTKGGSLIFASTETAIIEACEYGGIKLDDPKKYIVKADEGFYADVLDGTMTVHDKLRPALDAPGKRLGSYTRRGSYHMGFYDGWDSSEMEDWQRANANYVNGSKSSTPSTSLATQPSTYQDGPMIPMQRYQITGDPKAPKVGDRRKYVTHSGDLYTEVCYKVSDDGVAMWSLLIGGTTAEVDQGKAPTTTGSNAPNGTANDADAGRASGTADEPFTSQHVAQVGDYITIDKQLVTFDDYDQKGALCGVVTKVNSDGTIIVEFRSAVLHRWATDYDVVYRPSVDGMNALEALTSQIDDIDEAIEVYRDHADWIGTDDELDDVALFTL